MQISRGFEYGVRHILSQIDGKISTAVCLELNMAEDDFYSLLHLGAIYADGKRIHADTLVKTNDYLRVHTKPRRFNTAPIDWRKTILFENEHYLVINKPAAIPVHPTVDNIRENILACLETEINQQLYITHRLDVPTQGLIVYAKSKEFQSLFNKILIEQKVTKKYLARCEGQLALTGLIEHYMEPSPRGPKKVSRLPQEGWIDCRLRIEQCRYHAADGNTLVDIELLTGRTHQIRAQLSELGHPIVGDSTYGARERYPEDRIDLMARYLEFIDPLSQELRKFEISDSNFAD